MTKTIYASALLVDNKIKFWRVSGNKKSCVGDFDWDFHYVGEEVAECMNNPLCRVEFTEFAESDSVTSEDIFKRLAPEWFGQWPLIEGYQGVSPYLGGGEWPGVRVKPVTNFEKWKAEIAKMTPKAQPKRLTMKMLGFAQCAPRSATAMLLPEIARGYFSLGQKRSQRHDETRNTRSRHKMRVRGAGAA